MPIHADRSESSGTQVVESAARLVNIGVPEDFDPLISTT
jgi:hypothetical protein